MKAAENVIRDRPDYESFPRGFSSWKFICKVNLEPDILLALQPDLIHRSLENHMCFHYVWLPSSTWKGIGLKRVTYLKLDTNWSMLLPYGLNMWKRKTSTKIRIQHNRIKQTKEMKRCDLLGHNSIFYIYLLEEKEGWFTTGYRETDNFSNEHEIYQ